MFHIDLVGHQDDLPVASAIAELREQATVCRIIGSYPRAR
jgi:chorismate mutase/prephenate dehydratase